jgi:hypothetical protein
MNQLATLSLEKQFRQCSFEYIVQFMDADQARMVLIDLHAKMLVAEANFERLAYEYEME